MHLKISPFSSPDCLTCLLVKVIIIFHCETFSLKTTIFRFVFSRHGWLQFMSRHFWPSGWPHTVNTFQRSQHFYLADKLLLTKCRCCARSKWWTGIKNEIIEILDWAECHHQFPMNCCLHTNWIDIWDLSCLHACKRWARSRSQYPLTCTGFIQQRKVYLIIFHVKENIDSTDVDQSSSQVWPVLSSLEYSVYSHSHNQTAQN